MNKLFLLISILLSFKSFGEAISCALLNLSEQEKYRIFTKSR